MEKPNWDRIQEIYHACADVPSSDRQAFVAKACAHDPVMFREVMELLDAGDSSGDFLQEPIVRFGTDDLVGRTIDGRYLIKSEIGNGGMSEVYLAHDQKLGQRVVVKILSQLLLGDQYARQKFKQEVEALSRMRHDGVVRVFDKDELEDGRPYIVLEHVDGEMLRSRIRPEGMNLELAAAILKQIGAALDHVHRNGVFHRDLKPANIILKTDSDSVVLVDFGIAKVKESVVAPSTINGTAFGTLGYISPEQLRGETVTAASDIYSMAVIAYEMITGRLPFQPTSPAHLLELQRAGIRAKPTDLRPDLSVAAENVIRRALSFKPAARYDNANEFGDKLAQALVDPPDPYHDKRWLIAAIVVVVVVALLSFGIYWYTHRVTANQPISSLVAKEPNRSFTYYLTVQRTRGGKEYQEPFQSNGEETFEGGDKFRLNVNTPVPAYVYVINETPPGPNDTNFKMIFPSATTNNGSASLGANQTIQSDSFTFQGRGGDENFWIVWSVSPVAELEHAKLEAFKHPKGGLTGQNLDTVKEFLRGKQLEQKVPVFHYKKDQTAIPRGPSDLLVILAQFKSR